jgi:hypothetical protein
MGDNKISEAVFGAAQTAFIDGRGNLNDNLRAALEAAFAHLQGEAVPVGQVVEETACDSTVCKGVLFATYILSDSYKPGALLYTHPQPAELAEQQGVDGYDKRADLIARLYMARDMERAGAWSYLFAEAADALAATVKQQVSEVQGDAEMRAEWIAAGGKIHGPNVETVTMPEADYFRFRTALAARQPGAQEPVPFSVESKAFEAHAASRKLNLCQHPLHYLFLDRVTNEARQAWKAALAFAPPAQGIDPVHVEVIESLLQVAYAAFTLADDTEDDDDSLTVTRSDFYALSAALDRLDELPDDQPGYVMECAAKARWALRGLIDQRDAAPGVGQ